MLAVLALSLVALVQAPAVCGVAGRVMDETGEPVPNLRVVAARVEFIGGRKQVSSSTLASSEVTGEGAVTDALGDYRIPKLPPHEYYVNVLPRPTGGASSVQPRIRFGPTFYPSALDPSSATSIDLRTSCSAEGINIVVRAVPLATISGVVLGTDGSPSRTGGVTVTAIPDGGAARLRSVRVRPDGTFAFEDMAPGRYRFRGSPVAGAGGGRLPAIPTAEVSWTGQTSPELYLRQNDRLQCADVSR